MALKKRERLIAEAYNIAIFASRSDPGAQSAISNGLNRAARTLQELSPGFDKAEFMERATHPFPE
jgi:hypothetical protein